MAAAAAPSDAIGEPARGGMEVLLHPLVVLNISDHHTRAKTTSREGDRRVVGALLGVQTGRKLEIHTSFELVAKIAADGTVEIDPVYAEEKKNHYMQVFPTYDLVGWYTTGRGLSQKDLAPHQTIMKMNESPIVLVMDPRPPTGTTQLPVWCYETVVKFIDAETPSYDFGKIPYVIESEESERISIDNVAHGTGAGSMLTPLATYRDAVRMLQSRIRVVRDYLAAVEKGQHPTDHALLRSISSLCHKLPAMDSLKFTRSYQTEYADALLIAYLGTLTKACSSLNDLFAIIPNERQAAGRGRRSFY
eukprot:TRINITY_DN20795_c0_g1_i1.p2 TRINITY_DN20795_c0_g1~~TRINITY_DN20795_c0_g1_i1.p2  ORF type:complete len:305 (+),score=101.08 TRINITY_DN20795_c0_g1_i1:81-995(+)